MLGGSGEAEHGAGFYVQARSDLHRAQSLLRPIVASGGAFAGPLLLDYNIPVQDGSTKAGGVLRVDLYRQAGGTGRDPELLAEWHEDALDDFGMRRDPKVPQSLTQLVSSPCGSRCRTCSR